MVKCAINLLWLRTIATNVVIHNSEKDIASKSEVKEFGWHFVIHTSTIDYINGCKYFTIFIDFYLN